MDIQAFLDLQYSKRPARISLERFLSGELSIEVWQKEARGMLKACLGTFPQNLPPLDIQFYETIHMPGVVMRRMTYVSEEGLVTPAYHLVPEGATGVLPGMVAIAGHGYGCKGCVGLTEDGSVDDTIEGDYSHKFALTLARRGFAVIAPEPFGFGDLRLPEDAEKSPHHSSCDRVGGFLTMLGRTTSGVRVLQAQRAIDALAAIGGVDMSRVGMMGISGGGLVTAFTSALDERIAACVVSGYSNTFRDSVMAMPHCVDNFFPGLALDLEMPDILACVAPRPMLWEAGTEDPIFPMFGVEKAYHSVERVYEKLGVNDRFALDAFEGGHMISGAKSYDFLQASLGAIAP